MIHSKRCILFILLCLLFTTAFAPGQLYALGSEYWELPAEFSPGPGRFPTSAYNDTVSVLLWQEREGSETDLYRIRLSLAVKEPGKDWVIRPSIAGPYEYSGTEPPVSSIVIDKNNRILIASAVSSSETEILISDDLGQSFTSRRIGGGSEGALAPRISIRSDAGYLLFVTRGGEDSLTLFYSRSDDGEDWTDFRPFVTDRTLRLNFLPAHTAFNGRDYVVFQSLTGDVRPAFQLFMKTSTDGGLSWSPAKQVTNFEEYYGNSLREASAFDNQRPHLLALKDSLFLSWERRIGSTAPQIYAAKLSADATLIGEAEQVSIGGATCSNPVGFSYQGEEAVLWFDNRMGRTRVYAAQRRGIEWQNSELSGSTLDASFARPLVHPDGLYIFWQALGRGAQRIYVLEPDTSVVSPVLSGVNFRDGQRAKRDIVTVAWTLPQDPSGISGFSYSWSQDPYLEPPRTLMSYSAVTSLEQNADKDGTWYFSLRAQDYAGNWSDVSRISFVRDTTPPPAANIVLPELDNNGYLESNTFTIRWNPPPASDIRGYTWSLEYIAPLSRYGDMEPESFYSAVQTSYPGTQVPQRVMGTDTLVSFTNQDNGVWRFSLAAVDQVGNIGPVSNAYFRMDKYIPYTYVRYADATQNEQGILNLRIIGRGFTEGGRIERIFLDRDGKAPYDREFLLEDGAYSIASDREIRALNAEDLDEGQYRIGLIHPSRGLYLTGPVIQIDEMGTVKFGDYSREWQPSYTRSVIRRFTLDSGLLVMLAMLLFSAAAILVSLRGIAQVLSESTQIRMEAVALITGDLMPSEKRKRLKSVKRKGGGLRLKLASFTIGLVVFIVALISIPLSLMMTRTQEATLLQGLKDRSRVLLESLASGARAYLPSQNVLELGFLPDQTDAVPEAVYATISGFGSDSNIYSDHVWASNDPDLLEKIDTEEFIPGTSRLTDILSGRLPDIAAELDERARIEVGALSESIAELTREGLALALRTDEESVQRRDDIQLTTRTLETRLNERLSGIASEIGSEPAFPEERITSDGTKRYIFFKPVMYRQGSEDQYFRGLVRLEVSIDSIIEQVASGRQELLRVIALVAFIAIGIGVFGALLLSSLIIRPITKLVSHVEMIRDTEDKAKLEGKDIDIKTRDELAILGATINDMTHGLVKAAQASQDLTIGKEVQKKFIPLEVDSMGNKLSSGYKDTKNAEFFGYYEGAKGVSGDYFDYVDLDGRYYAIIKCDVAGKGIPAALIMIQVATMFLSYFKNWKPTAEGLKIHKLVYQINDFIETLGFKGRFAAFTLCLFDSQSGLVRFCNAGDNIVHWFDASERCMKTAVLQETPATGVLPNDLVDMKGGYPVQTINLDHGDVLMLYTDGIEEAKRKFRNMELKEVVCSEGQPETAHGNHQVGQGDEELGPDRVDAIINTVMNKGRYHLEKYHNPVPDEKLDFDFTDCTGSVEETIMALVSVEKIFRMYKDPKAGDDVRVLVDRKVDAFLKTHFLQYRDYCSYTKDHTDQAEYMYYTRVREDEQYDDLTILGIRRK